MTRKSPPLHAASSCENTEFAAAVRDLSAREGLAVRVVSKHRDFGGATAWGGKDPRISVGPSLLAQPAPVQQWVAAHEFGHIIARHSFIRSLAAAFTIVLGWALVVLVLDVILTSEAQESTAYEAILSFSGAVTVAAFGRTFAVLIRRSEWAADAYACNADSHMPPEAVRWLRKHEGRLARCLLVKPFRTHPTPERRYEACHAEPVGGVPER